MALQQGPPDFNGVGVGVKDLATAEAYIRRARGVESVVPYGISSGALRAGLLLGVQPGPTRWHADCCLPGTEVETMARPEQEGPITCLGGKGVRVVGEVHGVGTVVCAGEVEGNLHIEGMVQIPAEGAVRGDLRVWVADIAGTVQGDITTRRRLILRATAHVQGDVVTPELVVEAGAILQGQIRMTGEAAERASGAPPAAPALVS
jgi:cytoskeletal protein CcmA (bactofilin family)